MLLSKRAYSLLNCKKINRMKFHKKRKRLSRYRVLANDGSILCPAFLLLSMAFPKKSPRYTAIIKRGDKLSNCLMDLEIKYMDEIIYSEGYSGNLTPFASKEAVLDVIRCEMNILYDRYKLWVLPDIHSDEFPVIRNKDKLRAAVYLQKYIKKRYPNRSYLQVRSRALKSYTNLKKEYQKFRDCVMHTPANLFPAEYER